MISKYDSYVTLTDGQACGYTAIVKIESEKEGWSIIKRAVELGWCPNASFNVPYCLRNDKLKPGIYWNEEAYNYQYVAAWTPADGRVDLSNGFKATSVKCKDCKGSGKYAGILVEEDCRACNGTGKA